MYNPLYESLMKAKVDRRTASRVSVELNPARFINREELLRFQKNTAVEMIELKGHTTEIARHYQEATVALLSDRDEKMREQFFRHQKETRDCLSGVDKQLADNEASVKQHRIESAAWLDRRVHQMDVRATEREAQGRAENQKFLAEMDKREALRLKEQEKREALRLKEQEQREAARETKLEKLLADMDKREALRLQEQDKREALRLKEQEKREAEREAKLEKREAKREAKLEKLLADMDKREALRKQEQEKRDALSKAEQDKREALSKAEQDKRDSALKQFVTQQTAGINRALLYLLIGTVLSALLPAALQALQRVQPPQGTTATATQTAPTAQAAEAAPTAPERTPPTDQQKVVR